MKDFLYYLIKAFENFVFTVLYRVEIEGLENIPPKGGAILAANHTSLLDPQVMFYISPRKWHAITGKWLFDLWWLGWVFRVVESIPTGGSIEKAVDMLNKEKLVLIFPEGRCACSIKKREMLLKPHKGVAVFALKTGAPVIPIGIMGTLKAWPEKNIFPRFFKKIKVRIGKPIYFNKYDSRHTPKSLSEEVLDKIMRSIKDQIY